MKKIYLIGIPNSGKTTLGKRLADTMKLPFYDTDSLTCNKLKLKHPTDLFRMALNGQFLIAQTKVVHKLSRIKKAAIISTGAEVALVPECAELMKKTGIIVNIHRNPEISIDCFRNTAKRKLRCIDGDGTVTYMEEEAIKSYALESSQYETLADFTLDNNSTEEEGLGKLMSLLQPVIADGK